MDNFKQFCINITNPMLENLSTDECDACGYDKNVIDNITRDIRNKLDFIDRISIPYIEGKFEKLDNVGKLLEYMKLEDVPDLLINYIARKVYGEPYNKLSNDRRSIIAILSIYILIYNFKGGLM